MAALPMKKVWEARRLIKRGYSVKEVSKIVIASESWVRNYTKAEMAARNS